MATVKITDLPAINTINANTANTVLVCVDIPTNITGRMNLTTLATGLYSNNNLILGSNNTISANALTLTNGIIYTPKVYAGAQTAITIDFSNTAVHRANIAADYAVSFSNFVLGKAVEVWVTNTSGATKTFTHGCSAINSTTNSTTHSHPGTSTIVAKYISFGTDSANVLVQIVHA
jgi:hypothetical protein